MQKKLGITQEEYAERRQQIFKKMPVSSIAILPAASQKFRNADTEYPFRQESNFYYLTGFCESESVMVLIKENSKEEFILFCMPNLLEKAVWVGARAGVEGAQKTFGADRAYLFEELDRIIPELIKDKQQILYSFKEDSWNKHVANWIHEIEVQARKEHAAHRMLNSGIMTPGQAINTFSPKEDYVLPLIHRERVVKSPAEIQLIKEAAKISAKAHMDLMRQCRPGKMEYELEALFIQECMKHGCRAMAYPTIVGGGANACTLHYTANNAPLKDGDLVLVDAGGEYQYYASDITRTFPVNGKFTVEQKTIYELVLKSQLAAIALVQPGTPWNKLQEIIVQIMVEGLVALGILQGEVKTLIEQKMYRKFYMHSSGHWLGLDVHDVGEYKVDETWRPLKPGMVFTIEPGIYIAPNQPDVDKKWWGIGVRIEDDILVTESGCEVLTKDALKTVEAIEHWMTTARGV